MYIKLYQGERNEKNTFVYYLILDAESIESAVESLKKAIPDFVKEIHKSRNKGYLERIIAYSKCLCDRSSLLINELISLRVTAIIIGEDRMLPISLEEIDDKINSLCKSIDVIRECINKLLL